MRCPVCNYHDMFDDDNHPGEQWWCMRCGTVVDYSGVAVPDLMKAWLSERGKLDELEKVTDFASVW